VIYDVLFKTSAETMSTIAADPKNLGARIGLISLLHTWARRSAASPRAHDLAERRHREARRR
jgi:hypothetical protein